jgi:hypothetical protein
VRATSSAPPAAGPVGAPAAQPPPGPVPAATHRMSTATTRSVAQAGRARLVRAAARLGPQRVRYRCCRRRSVARGRRGLGEPAEAGTWPTVAAAVPVAVATSVVVVAPRWSAQVPVAVGEGRALDRSALPSRPPRTPPRCGSLGCCRRSRRLPFPRRAPRSRWARRSPRASRAPLLPGVLAFRPALTRTAAPRVRRSTPPRPACTPSR